MGSNPGEEGLVTFAELWQWLLERRRFILVVAGITTTVALAVAIFATPRYRATVMLAPPPSSADAGGLGGLAGQFGGLAGLAGIDLEGGQNLEQTLVVLQSRAFIENFLQEDGVLQALCDERWDEQQGRWITDRSFTASMRSALAGLLARVSGDRAAPSDGGDGSPDLWAEYRKFSSNMNVFKDKRTQIVSVSVDFKDPTIAAGWANRLPRKLNEQLRERAAAESARNLEYLQQELSGTEVVELRQSLYRLIEREQKRAMAANVSEEYAVRILADAPVPRERVFPKRTILVVGGLLLGLLGGGLWVIAVRMLFGPRPKAAKV